MHVSTHTHMFMTRAYDARIHIHPYKHACTHAHTPSYALIAHTHSYTYTQTHIYTRTPFHTNIHAGTYVRHRLQTSGTRNTCAYRTDTAVYTGTQTIIQVHSGTDRQAHAQTQTSQTQTSHAQTDTYACLWSIACANPHTQNL